jgi:Fic family protein
MRMPKIPPDVSFPTDTDKVQKIFGHYSQYANGKYVHWDKLVRYSPPDGLTHDDWWSAIKLARRAQYKKVPLVDKKSASFVYTLAEPIPEQIHDIDKRAAGMIEMPESITNPETKDRYYVSSLIEEAITSSQIEGATTTRQVAQDMIRAGRPPRDRSEQMILNNFLAMQRISQLKSEALTPELILDLHEIVTENTLDDPATAGRLRTAKDEQVVVADENNQVFHFPPPPDQLEARLESLCKFANEEQQSGFIHPVIRAIILHFWLGYDHPFVDGNGRTARALFYWSMLRQGYWLFDFVSISNQILKAPTQYSRAFLLTESDENDLTYFILYHLTVIQRAIDALHSYIKRKTEELRGVERVLSATGLNHRQRALLSHALRHPHHQYSIESHRKSHGVVYETARTDLIELKDLGYLNAHKRGRTWYFTPVPSIETVVTGDST